MRDTSLGLQTRFWWDLAQILKSSWHEPARKRITPRTREHKHSLPAGQCWAATNFLQYLVKEQLHSKQNEGSSTNGERRWGGDRKRWYSWGHPQSWRRLPKDDQGMGGVGKRRNYEPILLFPFHPCQEHTSELRIRHASSPSTKKSFFLHPLLWVLPFSRHLLILILSFTHRPRESSG